MVRLVKNPSSLSVDSAERDVLWRSGGWEVEAVEIV